MQGTPNTMVTKSIHQDGHIETEKRTKKLPSGPLGSEYKKKKLVCTGNNLHRDCLTRDLRDQLKRPHRSKKRVDAIRKVSIGSGQQSFDTSCNVLISATHLSMLKEKHKFPWVVFTLENSFYFLIQGAFNRPKPNNLRVTTISSVMRQTHLKM